MSNLMPGFMDDYGWDDADEEQEDCPYCGSPIPVPGTPTCGRFACVEADIVAEVEMRDSDDR